MVNTIIWGLTIWGALSVLASAAYIGIKCYINSKRMDQRFVTRKEIYEMGYDCGFLNKEYDQNAFNFIEDREIREDMLLVYNGGFQEGLADYHYLRRDNPLN